MAAVIAVAGGWVSVPEPGLGPEPEPGSAGPADPLVSLAAAPFACAISEMMSGTCW